MSDKNNKEEAFETIDAVITWMDQEEQEGRQFPPKMKGKLIKAAGVIRDDLDDPPIHINQDGAELLYE